jgi:hypothetical protein
VDIHAVVWMMGAPCRGTGSAAGTEEEWWHG